MDMSGSSQGSPIATIHATDPASASRSLALCDVSPFSREGDHQTAVA
jgi:hypothetical protein